MIRLRLLLALLGCLLASSLAETAQLRAANAVVNAGPLNVNLDGKVVLSNVDSNSVTAYTQVEASNGTSSLLIQFSNNNSTLYNGTVSLGAKTVHTLFISGHLMENQTAIEVAAVKDNNDPAGSATSARIRFFNAATGPSLDVKADTETIASKVDYNDAGEYVTLEEGEYIFTAENDDEVVATLPVVVVGGNVYTVIAMGMNGTVSLQVVSDASYEFIKVRAAHASPSTPSIEVLLETSQNHTVQLAKDLKYQKFSEYMLLPLRNYSHVIVKAGEETLGSFEVGAFTAGEDVTVAVIGVHKNGTDTPLNAVVLVDKNTAPQHSMEASIKFVHVASGVARVDVSIGGHTLYSNISYQMESGYKSLAAGTYDVVIKNAENGNTLLNHKNLVVGAGSVLALYAEGISGSNETTPLTLVASVDATYSYFTVRAVHASPDTPTVDIIRSFGSTNETLFTGVSYKEVTDYKTLPIMNSTIIVTAGDKLVLSSDHKFSKNTVNSFVVAGLEDDLSAAVVEDMNAAPTSGTQARVRLMNASPNSAPLTLEINGEKLFTGVAFPTASEYKSIDAGHSNVTIPGNNGTILLTKEFDFIGGGVFTIFVEGMEGEGNSTLNAVFSTDAAYNFTTVRVTHAVNGAAAVDIVLDNGMNSTVLFSNVAFGTTTKYKNTVLDGFTIKVTKAGDHDDVLFTAKPTLKEDEVYTLLAAGSTAENGTTPDIYPIMDNNAAPTSAMKARVRFIHASPGAPPFTVRANDLEIFEGISYAQASNYTYADAGTYRVGVYLASNDTTNPVFILSDFKVEGGKVYTLIADGVVGHNLKVEAVSDASYEYFQVRAVHAAAKLGPVDVCFNKTDCFTNVDFSNSTNFKSFTAGGVTSVEVFPHGEEKALFTKEVNFEVGKDSTFLIVGMGGENSTYPVKAVVLVDSYTVPTSDRKSSIRFVQASPMDGEVTVKLNGTNQFSNVNYTMATEYKEVDSDTYELEVILPGDSNTTLKRTVELDGGSVYTIYLEGIQGGEPELEIVVFRDYFPPPTFKLRIFQASPDTKAVDVLIGGRADFTDIAYEDVSKYNSLHEGTMNLKFVPVKQLGPVIYEAKDLKFEKQNTYSLFLVGLQEHTNETDQALNTLVIEDGNALPDKKKVKVRFVHASPDTVTVDLKADDKVLFKNVSYMEASDYAVIDAQSYTLSLVGMEASKELLSSKVDLQTSDGAAVYTFVLEGLSKGKPALKIIPFLDAGQGPPHAGSSSEAGKKGNKGLVIGLIVGGCILGVILLAAIGFVVYKKKQRTAGYETIPAADD